MKKALLLIKICAICALGTLSMNALAASKKTVETLFTCQQDDGDSWLEIGIALADGPGLNALIVQHDTDTSSSKLIAARPVIRTQRTGTIVFRDQSDTLRLIITRSVGSFQGDFSLIADGPGSIHSSNLICYKHSTVSYDAR